MPSSWVLFAQLVVGPVCLALASVFHGWGMVTLLAVGAVATAISFFLTQRKLSKAKAVSTAEGILGYVVQFVHASGVHGIRANYMALDSSKTLHMRYKYVAYRNFESERQWKEGDGSCAGKAIEMKVPVLGGYPGEYDDALVQSVTENAPFPVRVEPMVPLPEEKTRSVLCVPVLRHDHGEAVGLITFDDVVSLKETRLKNPAFLVAAGKLADSWLKMVP
jgi:hypothetical protein